ncbi:MAG TPA: DUF1428 domain-containing protein [Sphingomicrobium sp.]|nr:DUF1428 domain-containing protein [Sphingomicrobium sp.]
MTYFEGFALAVPTAKKQEFLDHAVKMSEVVGDFGVRRQLEAWANDVPHGEVTDFYRSVDAKDDETVVVSWFEYPSREARDAANERFRSDPRMQALSEGIPFDAKRMILGGFDGLVEAGEGPGRYINSFIAPVPLEKKDAYRKMTEAHAALFREYGALRLVQAWGDDVPDGNVTDFRRAVKAQPGETVVFAFIEWPSKEVNDQAWEKIMKDERMQPSGDVPFDGKRMFWGGFDVIIDTVSDAKVASAAAPVTA